MTAPNTSPLVSIGTYTEAAQNGKAEGIYRCRMDPASGALTREQTVPGVANPSFLAFDPQRRTLFAALETGTHDGTPGGGVSAFAVEPGTGALIFLNAQPTHGTFPCHLVVDPSGKYVLSANYGSGNVSVHPIEPDGWLGAATDVVQNVGSGPNAARQEHAHAHMVTFDPAGKFLLVVDLGIDKILVFTLDTATGKMVPHDIGAPNGGAMQAHAQAEPGAGPRHLAFHPNGRFVYVVNELNSTMTALAYDAAGGKFQTLQSLSTLPADFTGANSCAEIAVHPSGRFVYGSNRGHDTVAIFAIDPTTGELRAVGHEPTGGKNPRSFAIDPTGAFLLAANQGTDTVVTFRIDPDTGTLAPTGGIARIPTPVCVLFG